MISKESHMHTLHFVPPGQYFKLYHFLYAVAPHHIFCHRKETLGFQFWRQGYWADHLRGKPYHISALYVVDLQLFRQQAVGDKLRGVYDQLAKDPNSLANLDQDLPNYAQHVVPIRSLPQVRMCLSCIVAFTLCLCLCVDFTCHVIPCYWNYRNGSGAKLGALNHRKRR